LWRENIVKFIDSEKAILYNVDTYFDGVYTYEFGGAPLLRLVADLFQDNAILKEVSRGNF
jgi:hypothetical protein